ncbi:amidase [Amycolatopsis cihanbeyliensis]|uniref:Amidase n=1 Tax=Amycolatopsis cihanbeyliensis TaxID=1128664 RepID=A0A542DBR5_AMYCI|nr:amidase [Amycolatopsis cihanbeyliensis]TQJ00512.1 amidase [Amycolatopsis cihanbeyliensis]
MTGQATGCQGTDGPELGMWPAGEQLAALARREVSSTELLEVHLGRIRRFNPELVAVATLDEDGARARAAEADTAAARGAWLGPLHGLPVTVKDTLETAGLRSTAGAAELAGHIPDVDADAVGLLRAAGAVLVGKTNAATYAADAQTTNPVFGTTRNPWDPGRSPGGSSGGAAAAVSAGFTALDLSSELSGSIRLPAHCCGVFGLRPSHGIVPARGHIPRAPGSLTSNDMVTVGPIARTARDLELALDVLTGPARTRAGGWRLVLPPPRARSLSGYRIGVWLDDPLCPVEAAVGEVLQAAVDALATAGGRVAETRPVDRAEHDRLYLRLLHGATCLAPPQEVFEHDCVRAGELGAEDDSFEAWQLRGRTQRHRDWLLADEQRARQRASWHEFFTEYDALLCPVSPVPAIPHDTTPDVAARRITVNGQPRPYLDQIRWSCLASMAGLPAASVPAGRSPAGLPIGLQVIGPRLEDRTVLDIATRVAELTGGFQPPPLNEGTDLPLRRDT